MTTRSLLGSTESMSDWSTSSLGSKGARPSRCAASKYVVRLMPMKQILRPAASAACFTLASLQHVPTASPRATACGPPPDAPVTCACFMPLYARDQMLMVRNLQLHSLELTTKHPELLRLRCSREILPHHGLAADKVPALGLPLWVFFWISEL